MPYVTSVERIGRRIGRKEGFREMILEALDERFGEVPFFVSEAVNRIEDRDILKFLHRCAVQCISLEEFERALNGQR
ncbi:MAG: hypothetical protein QME81_19115 [bacterium]|nr:hypothetical protein [bacterium]